jgi:hypothetical protein
MTPSRCTGEPISWLRLERYRLGELAEAERARVAEHLTACATCAECMARIMADEAEILPALELAAGAARAASIATPAPPPRRWRLFAGAGALAAAAMMVLGIGRTWHGSATRTIEHETALLKGDGMAFVLVRDDGQRLADPQGVFRDGDRFKALVTCPPAMGANFDLVVFDASGASFPLAPAPGFACGNEVPLPGAFRLTAAAPGDHDTVCVVWTDGEQVDRRALSRSGAASPRSMCKELRATE